jgi:hypothetical protein
MLITSSQQTSTIDSVSIDRMKMKPEIVNLKKNQNQTFGQRTSQYRGVTRLVYPLVHFCHIENVVKQ